MPQRRALLAATNSQVANLWTPAQITTALWLDAADASTITLISGNVDQINDKSGNTRNAIAGTSARRPNYATNYQNGLPALSFDNSTNFLTVSNTALLGNLGTQSFAIFAAYKAGETTGSYGTLFANYPANNFGIYFGGVAPYLAPWGVYHQFGSPDSVDIDSSSYSSNVNYLIALIRQNSAYTGYTNGLQRNTVNNSTSVYSGANTSSPWYIGANSSGIEVADMKLYELLVINNAISATVRQQIEGYLAWKWGLQNSLPSDHPYKSAAPTV